MLIALYRVNKSGHMDYYYIHDYQGHLFAPYTFTAIWGKNLNTGKEKSFTFTTRLEMDEKLRELFIKRVKAGYKMLYSYPPTNNYLDIFDMAKQKEVS